MPMLHHVINSCDNFSLCFLTQSDLPYRFVCWLTGFTSNAASWFPLQRLKSERIPSFKCVLQRIAAYEQFAKPV